MSVERLECIVMEVLMVAQPLCSCTVYIFIKLVYLFCRCENGFYRLINFPSQHVETIVHSFNKAKIPFGLKPCLDLLDNKVYYDIIQGKLTRTAMYPFLVPLNIKQKSARESDSLI